MGRRSRNSCWTSCRGIWIGWRSMSAEEEVRRQKTEVRSRTGLILLVCVLAAPAWAQTWTPELQLKVQSVGDVTVSPDGKLVAWTQTRAIVDTERSEMETSLYLAHSDGTARRSVGS